MKPPQVAIMLLSLTVILIERRDKKSADKRRERNSGRAVS
jgi:hypothetical protein